MSNPLTAPSPPDVLDYWLEERERMINLCRRDTTAAAAFKAECAEDPLYWMRYTAWGFDPRKPPENIDDPLIPWNFQEDLTLQLVTMLQRARSEPLFRENLVIDKARDMGASFIILLIFQWFWQFHEGSFIIGSRKEEEVDKAGDMDTPFEKLRFQIRRQPDILLPPGFDIDSKRHSKELWLGTKPPGQGGAQIVGESANPDFGRGGRGLAAFLDEFQKWPFDEASWRACSGTVKVRIALGTPDGPFSRFATMVNGDENGNVPEERVHIRLPWHYHPDRQEGLEERNGKMWSLWLAMMQKKTDTETMAKEYLLNYNTSTKGVIMDTFNEELHVDPTLEVNPDEPVLVSLDPGLYFAVSWHQKDEHGTFKTLYSFALPEAHLDEIGTMILDRNSESFPDMQLYYVGDPQGAGRQVAGQTEADYVQLRRKFGISVDSAWLARMQAQQREPARISMLRSKLDERIEATGKAGLLIHPRNNTLIQAFKGGYRRQVDSNGQITPVVDRRHPWCDVMDTTGMAAVYWYLVQTGKLVPLTVRKTEKKWGNNAGGRQHQQGRNKGWGG